MNNQLSKIIPELFNRRGENVGDFKLDRMYEVLNRLSNPQNRIKSVHISGTNGKTSTTTMLSRVCSFMGLNVGVFTSPHINNVTERILLNGNEISETDFLAEYQKIIKVIELVEKEKPEFGKFGFFEVITVLAFDYFANNDSIDLCIIEVGLGGLLDCTNVIKTPVLSIITPIDIDHTNYLGSSLEEIAFQKAGIIKPNTPVVCAKQKPAALKVIRARAQKNNSKLYEIEGDFENNLKSIFIPKYLLENLKLVFKAAQIIGFDEMKIKSLIQNNISQITNVPGRFNIIKKKSDIILDVAHNPHGAKCLTNCLKDYLEYKAKNANRVFKKIAIIAIFEDKDYEACLDIYTKFFDEIICAQNTSLRALDSNKLTKIANDICIKNRAKCKINHAKNVASALEIAGKKLTSNNDILVISGSVITVADAFNALDLINN